MKVGNSGETWFEKQKCPNDCRKVMKAGANIGQAPTLFMPWLALFVPDKRGEADHIDHYGKEQDEVKPEVH